MTTNLPRQLVRTAGLLALLAAPLLTSGCIVVAAGAGAGAVAYVRGDLDATLDGTLEQAVRAANRAAEALKFAKVSEKTDALQSTLVLRNAADRKIEVRLDRASDRVTKIKIRVGVFGDEALSLAVLDQVKAAL